MIVEMVTYKFIQINMPSFIQTQIIYKESFGFLNLGPKDIHNS